MKTKRIIKPTSALLLMLITVALAPAQQPEPHWLVGRWEGVIAEFTGGGGPARTLQVTKVDPDGMVQGVWYITGQQIYPALVTATTSRVKVITIAKSVVELTREGESLVGTFVLSDGRTFAIKMAKSPVDVGQEKSVGSTPDYKLLVGVWTWRPTGGPFVWAALLTITDVSDVGLVTAVWKDPHWGTFPFTTQAIVKEGKITMTFGTRTKYHLAYDKGSDSLVGPLTDPPLSHQFGEWKVAHFRRTK